MNIDQALIEVRKDVGVIAKREKNSQQGFMFRGIDTILKKVGPALADHGVNCGPELLSLEDRDIVTSKGTRMREVTVTVAYHYRAVDGSEFIAIVPGEAADAGDKAVSKAMSVALRTAHIQMLQIPTGEIDPDSKTVTRKADPEVEVKKQIWDVARDKGWIKQAEHGETYEELQADFVTWSQGEDIAEASLDLLKKYLEHIQPKRKMQRST